MSRRPKQLSLNVRLYRVSCYGFLDCEVQAATPGAAKYQAFKLAREAGYFNYRRAFHAFLANGAEAQELRR